MDHAAVVARLVGGEGRLLLQHEERQPRAPREQRQRRREADDASPDDDGVDAHHGPSVRYHGRVMTAAQFFANAMKTVRILWAALTFSNVLMGLVTFLVPSQARNPPDGTTQAILGATAVGAAIASFVLPMRMYATNAGRARVEITPPELTPGGPGAARFANPLEAARRAMGLALTPFIVSMALSEVSSIIGLQLHMLGAPMTISTAFVAAGTLLAAIRLPSVARLVGPFERIHGASFAASEGGSY